MNVGQLEPYLGNELTLMDVQVSTTNTASLDLDQDIIVTELGKGNVNNSMFLRLLISDMGGQL